MPTMSLTVLPLKNAGSAPAGSGATSAAVSSTPRHGRHARTTGLLRLRRFLAAGLRLVRPRGPEPVAALVAAREHGAEHDQQRDAARGRAPIGRCGRAHGELAAKEVAPAGNLIADLLPEFRGSGGPV